MTDFEKHEKTKDHIKKAKKPDAFAEYDAKLPIVNGPWTEALEETRKKMDELTPIMKDFENDWDNYYHGNDPKEV